MKKILLIFLMLLFATPVYAIKTYNCNNRTGGGSRALDALSVDDLTDGARAIAIITSGSSKFYEYYKYVKSGTTAENTTTHPYWIRPDDYVSFGVWEEVIVDWVDTATIDTVNITNLTVTNMTVNGVLTGGIYHTSISDASGVTPSGVTVFGGYITGVSESSRTYVGDGSGVTMNVPSATGSGENFVYYLSNDTSESGCTTNILFRNGDNIISSDTITAGTSKYILSGATMSQRLVCWSSGVSEWNVIPVGGPDIDWD